MATGGEQAAAGEQTPLRSAEQGADTDLAAPSGWTKKLNPTRGGRFEVVFVAPTGEEIKSKRSLTIYLKAHPGGPSSSEFIWATGNTPRRSSRLSEKVKATESPEDGMPAKRGRPSSSKKGKKGKQEDAEEAPAESGDNVDAEEAKGTEVEMKDAEEAKGTEVEMKDAEEAKGTDVEMKDADNAQEEKKEASLEEKKESDTAQEEEKEAPVVDVAEKTEEAEAKTEGTVLPGDADAAEKTEEAEGNAEVSELPKGADAVEKTEEAEGNAEVSELPKGADAAEKTEEAEGNTEVSELPSDVSAPVSENIVDEKPAESEVALLDGEKTENGQAMESTGPAPAACSVEKKEEADSTINPVTPPPVEVNIDAPAAENSTDAPAAAKTAEDSADKDAHKDEQANAVNVDSNGQIQPGASTVKCT